jgi:hypothetical protein
MKLRLKINLPVGGHNAGDIIEVDADEKGTPLEQFWRRRLTDAAIDNCVEIVIAKTEPTKKGAE